MSNNNAANMEAKKKFVHVADEAVSGSLKVKEENGFGIEISVVKLEMLDKLVMLEKRE